MGDIRRAQTYLLTSARFEGNSRPLDYITHGLLFRLRTKQRRSNTKLIGSDLSLYDCSITYTIDLSDNRTHDLWQD